MDTKNVIAAISLSAAVIILYSLFFAPEPSQKVENLSEKNIKQNSDTPSLEQNETLVKISRDEAIDQSDRINFENNNIKGSISLNGISLTVNDVKSNQFNCMIIPHTFKNTDIQSYKKNQILNLEVDMLARYAHFSNLGK